MFIRKKKSANSDKRTVEIVKGERFGGKVRQIIKAYIGVIRNPDDEERIMALARIKLLELIKEENIQNNKSITDEEALQLTKRGKRRKIQAPKDSEDQTPVGILLENLREEYRLVEGLHAIAGKALEALNVGSLFRTKKQNTLFNHLVLTRLGYAKSKRGLCATMKTKMQLSYTEDQVYRLMDNLYPRIDLIKRKIFEHTRALMPKATVLLFDVTTLYCESVTPDEVRNFGFSKDGKLNNTQVVLALATNEAGLPIGYEVFPGNFAEVHTLLEAIKKWNQTLSMGKVCFIGDRAMFSENNIRLIEAHGHEYIIAAKLRGQSENVKEKILNKDNYQPVQWENELGQLAEFELPQADVCRCEINAHLLGYTLVEKEGQLIALQYLTPTGESKQVDLNCFPELQSDIQALKGYTQACPCVLLTPEEYQLAPHCFHETVIALEDKVIYKNMSILFETLQNEEKIKLLQHIKKGKIPGSLMKKLWPSYQGKRHKNIPYTFIQSYFPEHDKPTRRLCVSYKLSRAERDRQQRERILTRLHDKEGKVNKVLRTTAKMFMSAEGKATLDSVKIAEAEKWDGLHGIITNITAESAQNLLSRYSQLWRIEEAFRINKHQLSMRPMYHFKPERIHAHLAICYVTFAVLKLIEYQTALTQRILSVNDILAALLNTEASIYYDVSTQKRYKVPGYLSDNAKTLYKAFGVVHQQSISQYYL